MIAACVAVFGCSRAAPTPGPPPARTGLGEAEKKRVEALDAELDRHFGDGDFAGAAGAAREIAAIRAAGPRLVDFHVADNNRLAAGMGALDWPRIVRTLREIGYDGALTNEFVAAIDRTPVSPFPDQIEPNPVDISPEQLKFIEDHGSSLLSEAFYTSLMAKTAQTLLPLIG